MAANTETAIWLAIKSRIDALLPTVAKSWPSQTFTPPSSNGLLLPYIRVGRISSAPTRQFVADGKESRREGFIILTLVYPLGNEQSFYDQMAGQVADHFNDSVKMRFASLCVSIPSYPHIVEGYTENGYWEIPVRIPWLCFA